MTDHSKKLGIRALSSDQRKELALALLARPQRAEDGLASLRLRFPSAPSSMVHTAAHHVYQDGPEAVIDFLADAELAIREADHDLDMGVTWELLYHLYNWLQFRAVLPQGKQDLVDLVAELKEFTKDKDWDAVAKTVQELEDLVEGDRTPPDVIQP